MTLKINARTILQYIVPPIITVGLCIFLYRDINWSEVADGLRATNFYLIAAFLSCNILAMLARARRWQIQLRAMDVNPPFADMARSIFGTYAVNLIFPRLGEIWRCTYIAKVSNSGFSRIFGSMVADRLVDTLCILFLSLTTFILAAPAMSRFAAESNMIERLTDIGSSPWTIFLLFILFIICVLCIYAPWEPFISTRRFVGNMWNGFMALFSMRSGRGAWIMLTAAIWIAYGTGMYLSLIAYPPTASVVAENGFLCVLITFVFGSLAMAIPSNGGIGPWQASVLLSLSGIYGMDTTTALTFATINLAFSTLLSVALGLYTFAVPSSAAKKVPAEN